MFRRVGIISGGTVSKRIFGKRIFSGGVLAVLAFGLLVVLVLTAAACSMLGEDDPPWDTDIPESEALKASLGTWNPDGTQIAFEYTPQVLTTESGGIDQLWIADLETGERRPVTRSRVAAPDWSPDSAWFVFHTASIPHYLFKINARGDSLVQLSGPGSPNPDLEDTVTGRWSPSGDRLLYAVSAGEDSGIYTMRPDGSSVEKLVAWTASPSSNIDHYDVLRTTTPAYGYTAIGSTTGTTYTDTFIWCASSYDADAEYYYQVVAVSNEGLESDPSNSISTLGSDEAPYGYSPGDSVAVAIEPKAPGRQAPRPEAFALEGSYPNPARHGATIRYALPEAHAVELTLYDIQGQKVATLARGTKPAGFHDVQLDVQDLPSGVYLYRLTAGSFTDTKQLVVVR